MDWDDGKEFGELRWREREGIFDKEHYPIDHVTQMRALRTFLGAMTPDHLRPCTGKSRIQCRPAGTLSAFALHSAAQPDFVCGWLFAPATDTRLTLSGLATGRFQLHWYDPWTGEPVPGLAAQGIEVSEKGAVEIDAAVALKALRAAGAVQPFPTKTRLARGQDAAFKLQRDAE
jgi:hypothetical protein